MNLFSEFKQPSSAYRGKPFWAWNGDLEPAELRRQIRVFAQMGLGGFFMHSRVGLVTPYMGKKWLDCIAACNDEARKLRMEPWLYDEDRWPSGAAGGLVTCHKQYRQHFVRVWVVPAAEYKPRPGALGAWLARIENGYLHDLRRWTRREATQAGLDVSVLVFTLETPPCSSWYNGYTYLDVLSADAVRAFIDSTHEVYARNFSSEFGGLIPGIFTDEPNFQWDGDDSIPPEGHATAWVPWTPRLPGIFQQRYGYDVLDHLPELFMDPGDGSLSRARFHFNDCLTHLFTQNFSAQIGAWCEQHKLKFTGHVLCEQPIYYQASVVGSAMRFYEHMQAPGIDVLTQNNLEYDTAKQCASVLNQTGRTWMLSELYGCTGWDFDFEAHKAVGNWQMALGVNLRCHHLSFYTMAGEAKRDYPASISFQSSWWTHYRAVRTTSREGACC